MAMRTHMHMDTDMDMVDMDMDRDQTGTFARTPRTTAHGHACRAHARGATRAAACMRMYGSVIAPANSCGFS